MQRPNIPSNTNNVVRLDLFHEFGFVCRDQSLNSLCNANNCISPGLFSALLVVCIDQSLKPLVMLATVCVRIDFRHFFLYTETNVLIPLVIPTTLHDRIYINRN